MPTQADAAAYGTVPCGGQDGLRLPLAQAHVWLQRMSRDVREWVAGGGQGMCEAGVRLLAAAQARLSRPRWPFILYHISR